MFPVGLEGSAISSKFGGVYRVATYSSLSGPGTLKDMVKNTSGKIGTKYVETVVNTGGTALDITLHDLGDGDTDLDGHVDGFDLTAFINGWDPTGVKGSSWGTGDFTFNDKVDGFDLTAFINSWAPDGITFSAAAASVNPVPEPGTIVMLLIGAVGLLLYRKRR